MPKKRSSFNINTMLKLTMPLCFLILIGCNRQNLTLSDHEVPKVWMTYKGHHPAKEIPDLKASGVGAISVRKASAEILNLIRENDMKLILSIPEVVEAAYRIPEDKVERAIMIGGSYKGKAIDRNRFSFSAEEHTIIIENPAYDKINCYKTLGRYFPGMQDPLKAEVIIKKADFDGQQHLNIIDAEVEKKVDSLHWEIFFNLSGIEGDLDNVSLAVYWISEGTRDYWMFGDAASPASESTHDALRKAVHKMYDDWAEVNNGKFPLKDVIALRIGDECFQLSGHGNCPECSYPLWDYSESSINKYRELTNSEYPRGKCWPDMYGRNAYALWLYNYHHLNAELMTVVRNELDELGLENILTFRNITRYNVFHTLNDHDGSGLDLLSSKLDIVHIDPYPINAKGYNEDVIPVDMAYLSGLARRHDKLLIPWMQAHQYWPEYGGLAHPGPTDIEKMVEQHLVYGPDALMWLGYGNPPFNTFPYENPASWEKAGKLHQKFIHSDVHSPTAEIAVFRPYNVRALRDIDSTQHMDRFFTDKIITWLSLNNYFFNPFEPLSLKDFDKENTSDYKVFLAECGWLTKAELNGIISTGKKTVLFIFEAEKYQIDKHITGIENYNGTNWGHFKSSLNQKDIEIRAYDKYTLSQDVKVITSIENHPVIWKKGNVIFVAALIKGNGQFIEDLIYSDRN